MRKFMIASLALIGGAAFWSFSTTATPSTAPAPAPVVVQVRAQAAEARPQESAPIQVPPQAPAPVSQPGEATRAVTDGKTEKELAVLNVLKLNRPTPNTPESRVINMIEDFFRDSNVTPAQQQQLLIIFRDAKMNYEAAGIAYASSVDGDISDDAGRNTITRAGDDITQESLRRAEAVLTPMQFKEYRKIGVMLTIFTAALTFVDASGKPIPLPASVGQ